MATLALKERTVKAIIQEMVTYCNSRIVPESLRPAEVVIGEKNLFIVAIKVLGCMEGFSPSLTLPFRLRGDWIWCVDLETVLRAAPALAELLSITDNTLDFSPAVSPNEQSEIKSYITDNYKISIDI